MSIRQLVFLTVLALIGVAARQLLRAPLHFPGHSWALYIFALVFGSCYVSRRGAAAYMGVVAGVFGIVAVSRRGLLGFFDFLLPALVLELVRLLPNLFHPIVNRLLEGLATSYAMFLTKVAVDLVTGRPWEEVFLRRVASLIPYTVIGVFAGVFAHLLTRAARERSPARHDPPSGDGASGI